EPRCNRWQPCPGWKTEFVFVSRARPFEPRRERRDDGQHASRSSVKRMAVVHSHHEQRTSRLRGSEPPGGAGRAPQGEAAPPHGPMSASPRPRSGGSVGVSIVRAGKRALTLALTSPPRLDCLTPQEISVVIVSDLSRDLDQTIDLAAVDSREQMGFETE